MLFPLLEGCLTPNGVEKLNSKAQAAAELQRYLNGNNSASLIEILEATVKNFADQAYRTILITYRDMSMADFNKYKSQNNNFEKEGDREVLEN
jgi:hypothetical protein